MSERAEARSAPDLRLGATVLSGDPEAALRFLDLIFGGLKGGFAEFRYFTAGRRAKSADAPSYFPLPVDKDRLATEVLRRNGESSIAVGPAPRCRIPGAGRAGKDRDVTQVGCVWARLDYRRSARGALDVVRRIRDFPLRPSVVVNSGHGRDVYYVLNSPLSEGMLPEWDSMIRNLGLALRGEPAFNLSRVVGLPGTLNIEEPQNPVACTLSEEDSSWARYGPDEVKEAIARAPGSHSYDGGERVSPGQVSPDALRLRGVPHEVIKAVTTGQRIVLTGPNLWGLQEEIRRDRWIAKSLFERGLSAAEVKEVFRSNPHGCGGQWARDRRGERYLDSILEAALEEREGRGVREEWAGSDEYEIHPWPELPPHYEYQKDGSIWFKPPAREGDRKAPKPVKVSDTYISLAGIRENVDTGQISLVVKYEYLGRSLTSNIPRSRMADARQLVASLAGEGAPVTSVNARHVTSYLAACEHRFGARLPRTKVTSRFGHARGGGPFFLPGLGSDFEFDPASEGDASLFRAYASRRGSLQGWLGMTRTLAEERLMIPQVAILACFVPPLQSRLQIPNFILDIHGSTSTGKSTSLKLAASVYGGVNGPDSLVMQWMNTKVAIEQLAGTSSGLPLFLDDAQHCPADLKRSVVYMIANGRGKGRASRAGGVGEVATWNTVALSTSEEPLHECSPHEGARGRVLPVGGSTHPFPVGSSHLVRSLEAVVALNHGHAGEAYVRHLNNWTDSDWSRQHRRYSEIRKDLLNSSTCNVVDRVSGYIAAIQLGAEIACRLLGIQFKPETVSAWLLTQLVDEQSRQNLVLLALRALADFYIANIKHFAGDGQYSKEKPSRFMEWRGDTSTSGSCAVPWKLFSNLVSGIKLPC